MIGNLHQVCHFSLGNREFKSTRFELFDVVADDFFRLAVRQSCASAEYCFAITLNRLASERAASHKCPARQSFGSILVTGCGGGRGQGQGIRQKSCEEYTG